jgi:hypothetical protein
MAMVATTSPTDTGAGSRGLAVVFGFAPSNVRCAGHAAPAVLRIAGDAEVNMVDVGFGVASTRAGRFFGDSRDFIAVTASGIQVQGREQAAVILINTVQLKAARPASGMSVVPLFGGPLSPFVLTYRVPVGGFGTSLAGNVDLDGDGKHDLVVGAPLASFGADGNGAVFVFAGGMAGSGPRDALMVAVGDTNERGLFGHRVAISPKTAASPPYLLMGAPRSYRTGRANGAAHWMPFRF